jgi:predicted nuclease with TOPRIM domain
MTVATTARALDEAEAQLRDQLGRQAALRDQIERLESERASAREKLGERHNEVLKLEERLKAMQREAEAASRQVQMHARQGAAARKVGFPGTIIETGFDMEVGETVVVGTSRVQGGDKALIALLTAVSRRAAGK